jgi:hypothetical protein
MNHHLKEMKSRLDRVVDKSKNNAQDIANVEKRMEEMEEKL